MSDAVYNTASYFKYDYEDEWIIDPFVKEQLSGISDSIIFIDEGNEFIKTEERVLQTLSN